jgi:DNA-directed RNA polymerase specialized sigma24 family protein
MRVVEVHTMMDDKNGNELVKYSKALLMLQLQSLNEAEDPLKPEILLSRAGLSAKEIADLLGKNPAAVAKAIQRGGKAAA